MQVTCSVRNSHCDSLYTGAFTSSYTQLPRYRSQVSGTLTTVRSAAVAAAAFAEDSFSAASSSSRRLASSAPPSLTLGSVTSRSLSCPSSTLTPASAALALALALALATSIVLLLLLLPAAAAIAVEAGASRTRTMTSSPRLAMLPAARCAAPTVSWRTWRSGDLARSAPAPKGKSAMDLMSSL
ncbi:Os03g0291700 [Oryza sativa Japonica Group]|uniref:Os03g0291700 protein n=2 Tax=Oryza sativa subsp. japonica TaxID=39947 RepID=Q0DSS3_ORYSJ|nr:hypothetical protein EE612_016791 [Oryza sativa]BAF11715.1 Os03g0291700 [Oryza sativa Japonica Group]BAS83676.1 Os03g0291700 [Oryza sativa Japonica Group]|eukprot:NP_001049801.1 Os03g0291700 [Oryza sativa Japonica Group]